MKKITFLLFTILFLSKSGSAQHASKNVNLFFERDKYSLTAKQQILLDSICQIVEKLPITTIVINGNTDSDGSNKYNIRLSQHRADAVKTYLSTKNINKVLLQTDFFGETRPIDENETAKGKQQNRRVEIYFFYSTPPPIVVQPIKKELAMIKEKPISLKAEVKPLPKELTVYRKKITELPFTIEADPSCPPIEIEGDSAEISNITTFKTFCSEKTIEKNNLFTYSSDGTPLVSNGMFEFQTKNNACLTKPIKILYPIDSKTWDNEMTLWDIDKNGKWSPSTDKMKRVTINDSDFIEIETSCGGRKNFDKKICFEDITISLNSQQGLRITNIKIIYNNGKTKGLYGFPYQLNGESITVRIPARLITEKDSLTRLEVSAKNKQGNVFVLQQASLKKYVYPLAFRTCVQFGLEREKEGKKIIEYMLFGFIPIYLKGDQWLYILNESDFKKQPPTKVSLN